LQGAQVEKSELSSSSKEELLDQLVAEHQQLKARLRALNRHVALTSAERVEVAQLKKMKLRAKDRIALLRAHT
jgi:uncharacterized protein YdcH (DUF465 family)